MLRRTASAVPRYHSATRPRAMYGWSSFTPPRLRSRSHGRPRPMWSLSERGLYWVRTTTSSMSELTQFDSVKSMIRYLPPNGTAGLARSCDRMDRRSPSPPARITAIVRFTVAPPSLALDAVRCPVVDASTARRRVGERRVSVGERFHDASSRGRVRAALQEQARVDEVPLNMTAQWRCGAGRVAGVALVADDLAGLDLAALRGCRPGTSASCGRTRSGARSCGR